MDSDYLLRYEIYHFFKTISDSFKPSPLELVLIFVGIALFAGILIGVYRHQKKKAREASLLYSQKVFDNAIQKAKLENKEKDLLRLIAEKSPLDETKRYIIVQRAAAFDEAAGAAIETGEFDREEVNELRAKLEEFCFVEKHGIASTKDLPMGLHLYIIEKGSSTGQHGEIGLKTPETIQIVLRDDELSLETGTEVACYFKRGTDTYFFRTEVLSAEPGILMLPHPRPIKKVQRRKYYRKEIRKRVILQRSDGKNRIMTNLTDLGGGGASALNRDNLYKKGDSVLLTFSVPDYGEMQLSGKIVRTSRKGEKLHIQFDPMKEQVRDKIIAHTLHK